MRTASQRSETAPRPRSWRYCRGAAGNLSELPRRPVLVGAAREQLSRLPTASVDCCITSPPYYQLRDYGVAGQLGAEPHVDDWVSGLRGVLAEVARVLKPTGSLWLNLGDAYSRHARYGAPPKSLLLGPERLLLGLAADGWLVRNKVVWAKPNPMPRPVTDRLTTTYEPVYFLTRSPSYTFTLDDIREPHRSRRPAKSDSPASPAKYGGTAWAGALAGSNAGLLRAHREGRVGHPLGKNPGDVWTIATAGYRGAHFATFPEALVERPIRATCPERVCTACGQPWQRQVESLRQLLPACDCQADWRPGVVLDPFFGAGTVGVVAERLGRDWLGVELNPAYAALAEQRIQQARQGADKPEPRADAA